MTHKDPLAQYRRLNVEAQVDQASPHRLIELLFDGAISRLKQAEQAVLCADTAEKGRLLGRVQEILSTLRSSLDMPDQPAESAALIARQLPENLDALYEYCQTRLLRANIDNDAAAIAEVMQLLTTVADAWRQISP